MQTNTAEPMDASKQFLGELAGVTDPEQKRKTIGRLFIDVFDAEAKKIGGAEFLAQGKIDTRPFVALAICAVVLTMQEYYGGRLFFEQHIKSFLIDYEAKHPNCLMLFKYDEGGVGQRAGRSQSWRNQSIWGVANRMLRHVESDPAFGPHVPVYSNIAEHGNTSSASIPIAIDECIEKGKIKEGSLVLLTAFGGGATWGGTLIRF